MHTKRVDVFNKDVTKGNGFPFSKRTTYDRNMTISKKHGKAYRYLQRFSLLQQAAMQVSLTVLADGHLTIFLILDSSRFSRFAH